MSRLHFYELIVSLVGVGVGIGGFFWLNDTTDMLLGFILLIRGL